MFTEAFQKRFCFVMFITIIFIFFVQYCFLQYSTHFLVFFLNVLSPFQSVLQFQQDRVSENCQYNDVPHHQCFEGLSKQVQISTISDGVFRYCRYRFQVLQMFRYGTSVSSDPLMVEGFYQNFQGEDLTSVAFPSFYDQLCCPCDMW